MNIALSSTSGVILFLTTILIYFQLVYSLDGTFLKAQKVVPRIGRRSGDSFLKAAKNIPRIGRRGGNGLTEMRETRGWPWFRNQDNILPSRVTRTGPTSLTLWDRPTRYTQTQAESTYPWTDDNDDDDEVNINALFNKNFEQVEEDSNEDSQLLTPPKTSLYDTRLPQENPYSRQLRGDDEQLN